MSEENERPDPGAIALQLWTIREAIAADADLALARVRQAGFLSVELAPLPPERSASRLTALLERHGLKVVSVHCELPTAETIATWAKLARQCHCSRLIWHGWPRDPRFDSPAGVQALIASCNEAGALAREHGLMLGLHNHWWEFERLEGERPIRLLNESLHPEIFWQLDVYWAQTAGADLVETIKELKPRLHSIHWKDGPCVHGQPMTVLGQGKVDVPRACAALPHGIDWVIELDECATDRLEAARQSLVYLKSLI